MKRVIKARICRRHPDHEKLIPGNSAAIDKYFLLAFRRNVVRVHCSKRCKRAKSAQTTIASPMYAPTVTLVAAGLPTA